MGKRIEMGIHRIAMRLPMCVIITHFGPREASAGVEEISVSFAAGTLVLKFEFNQDMVSVSPALILNHHRLDRITGRSLQSVFTVLGKLLGARMRHFPSSPLRHVILALESLSVPTGPSKMPSPCSLSLSETLLRDVGYRRCQREK